MLHTVFCLTACTLVRLPRMQHKLMVSRDEALQFLWYDPSSRFTTREMVGGGGRLL